MPASADPKDTVPFSLKIDVAKPEAERPRFLLRFLSERESRQVRRLIQSARNEPDEDKAADTLDEAIRVGLADVERVRFRGKAITLENKPQDYLSTGELWELVYAVLTKPQLTEDERKNSASSAASQKEPTAPSAAGATA